MEFFRGGTLSNNWGALQKDFIEEVNKMMQNGTVLKYQARVKHLCALTKMNSPTRLEKFFISSFISEFKPELQPIIRLLHPRLLNQTLEQALLQEEFICP